MTGNKMNYIDEFLNYIKNDKNYSDLTYESYKKDLSEFKSYVSKDLLMVTKNDIKFYLQVLFDHDNQNSTVSRKISTLKSFYKYLKNEDFILINPASNIKYPKKEKRLPKFIQYNDLEKILVVSKNGTFGERNSLIIELMYSTGVRVSELVNIKINDIDFSKHQIRIMGKGSYERYVFYGDYTDEILSKYINNLRIKLLGNKNNDYLILNKDGDKITTRGIAKIIDNIIKETSINISVSPHSLRHTFATHLLDGGCDLRSVQELLGHKSINSTEVYTHVTSERLKSVYIKAHPRSRI